MALEPSGHRWAMSLADGQHHLIVWWDPSAGGYVAICGHRPGVTIGGTNGPIGKALRAFALRGENSKNDGKCEACERKAMELPKA